MWTSKAEAGLSKGCPGSFCPCSSSVFLLAPDVSRLCRSIDSLSLPFSCSWLSVTALSPCSDIAELSALHISASSRALDGPSSELGVSSLSCTTPNRLSSSASSSDRYLTRAGGSSPRARSASSRFDLDASEFGSGGPAPTPRVPRRWTDAPRRGAESCDVRRGERGEEMEMGERRLPAPAAALPSPAGGGIMGEGALDRSLVVRRPRNPLDFLDVIERWRSEELHADIGQYR